MAQHGKNVDAWFVIQPVSGGDYYECREDAHRQAERLNHGVTRFPGQKDVRQYPYVVRQIKVKAEDPYLISREQADAGHVRLLLSQERNDPAGTPSPSLVLNSHDPPDVPGRCVRLVNQLRCQQRRR